MKKIDLMIFDFDGTIVHSGDDLAAAVNHTLEQLGRSRLERETIIGYIGDGVRKLVERSLRDAFPEQFDNALKIFMTYYEEHLLDSTDLYPGVSDVLIHFAGKKKVIVTNKLHSFTMRIAEHLKITQHFDEIIGMDSRSFKKPDPRLVYPMLERWGCESGRTVVIGDGQNDILLAKNAGVMSCALLNGLGAKDMLLELGPDYVCDDITELKTLFY